MSFARHPDFRVQKFSIGEERQPLVVIDNVFAEPDQVFEMAASRSYSYVAQYFPGVRAKTPLSIQQFLLQQVRAECAAAFELPPTMNFTSCHFSLITTLPENLSYPQRIPHIDSTVFHELALVFYLFKRDQGGTAFYRHRKSGFEYVDLERRDEYYRHVELERESVERSSTGYIRGDTECYECIGQQSGIYNRMLVYRRTSLHSANFGPEIEFSSDPKRARLTVNGFLA